MSATVCRFPDRAHGHEKFIESIGCGLFVVVAPRLVIGSAAFAADTEADFRRPMRAADAAEQEAGRLRNQWLATEAALADGQESRRETRFRDGDRRRERGRSAGQGFDFPGDKRKRGLEKSRDTLKARKWRTADHDHPLAGNFSNSRAPPRSPASLPRRARSADGGVYDLERFGNARILHITDTHAQLLPGYFREPSVNLGIGAMAGQPPHLVGRAFLDRFGIKAESADCLCLHLARFREVRGALRQARRLCPSENPDRPLAQRGRAATFSAARRRRCLARHRARQYARAAPTWSRPQTCSASKR